MASSSCLLTSQFNVSLKIDRSSLFPGTDFKSHLSQRCVSALGSMDAERPSREMVVEKMSPLNDWRFLGGSKLIISRPTFGRYTKLCRSSTALHASWLNSPQIASSAFTLGTAAVLPFYTFMVVAPRADLTKKLVGSSIPYIALGILYAYLLVLSWTPDTIRLMFASKYLLPELPGIAKMFSSEMTLASAWIHLLAVDLFAARQVYYEGLKDNIETRHSVSLCLLFCPIGILAHCITKGVVRSRGATEH